MINNKVTVNKGIENAEKQLQKAKNRLTQEKKKANDARRRIENRHKYMMGGGSAVDASGYMDREER
ncbi:hypothetical protein bpr_IV069 (plasmid) [Butyrivibrio proteoclasticus B316]|uniref:Uncharacterized protein n=1 Tax=Butyrivibrio proteoclasticus (strain ATCC 51982 / DSM 14932 / B316) TaxID=515622 RepID=E0S4V2_BUTPB|nr:hypothetical protein [Butyrivibrio proteoclasticus]ADL36434.1 hypothetical protein bpr_IV069 [Butyrivibrio proteoclasticus B316]